MQSGGERATLCVEGSLLSLSIHPKSHWDILISLEHTALSVLLHSSHFKWQAAEQSDCFIGTAKRGAPIPFSRPGALVEEDLWCIKTGQVLKDFRNFKGRGGARNNKKGNDKHSA